MSQENTPQGTENLPTSGAAPAPEGTAAAPTEVNPLLDRSLLQDPAPAQPEPTPNSSDAHIEGPPDNAASEPASSLEELIGSELMEDPQTAFTAKYLMQIAGDLDHQRAFAKAAEYGDARFIDEAYLREALGDKADEAIRAATNLIEYATTYTEKLHERLYAEVPGGKQALEIAARHFRETASEQDQKLIVRLLDSGDFELMQHAVRNIVERAQKVVPTQGSQMHVAPTGLQPLSREEFGRMVLQNPNMSEQQYNALTARLRAGMQG